MQISKTVALVVLLLVASAVWIAAQDFALTPVTPTVVFGNDIGFRIEGTRAGTPVGRIVVKQDGKWVAADVGGAPATKRISER
jgi:hypothetical protein